MTDPAHPYTDELLAAAPVPDPRRQRGQAAADRAGRRGGGGRGSPGRNRPSGRRRLPVQRPLPARDRTVPRAGAAVAPGRRPDPSPLASASPATATRNGSPRRRGRPGSRRHRMPARSQEHPPCRCTTPADCLPRPAAGALPDKQPPGPLRQLQPVSRTRNCITARRTSCPYSPPDKAPPRDRPGRRRRLRRTAAIAGLAVAALAAAGCAGSGATSANSAKGNGPSATAASASSTLTIADTAFPTTMDPGGGQNAYNQYYDLAYDPLIVQTVSGGYAPGLATSWSYGPDNESFSFTLRTGVKFSDGSALNADAVKAWIQHEHEGPRRRRAQLPGQPHHHRRGQPDPAHAALQQAHPAAALRLQPGAGDGRDRQRQGGHGQLPGHRTPTARASTSSTRRRR